MRYGAACLLLFAASTASAFYSVSPNRGDVAGGTVVQLRNVNYTPLPTCNGCPPLQISFGGVPATKVTVVNAGYNTSDGFDVVAPPHAEGPVTITIGYGAFVVETIEHRFVYTVDREAVFVPVAVDGVAGTDGTLWSSELWVHNAADHDVALYPAYTTTFLGYDAWYGDRLIVKANSARRVPLNSAPYGVGAFIYPPSDAHDQLSYDLRLFDRGHPGSGTSMPVLRLDAMRRGKLTMLNIPADSASARRRLRIFAVYDSEYVVRVYDLDSGQELSERTLTARFPTDMPSPTTEVSTLDDDLAVSARSGATRLRVEVEQTYPPDSHFFWAFVSVTDNATQQVTIITPQ